MQYLLPGPLQVNHKAPGASAACYNQGGGGAMGIIQFNAVVGADQVIRPPAGIELPQGEIEVVVRPRLAVMQSRPGPGLCKGMVTYIAPDFDGPLEDMKEYIE